MIPTFSSLLGSNAANGASSTRNAPQSSGNGGNDDRDGGFDALMQSSPRSETQTRSPEQAGSHRAQNERPADKGEARKTDDGGQRAQNDTKTQESRSDDGPRRAESKSDDGASTDSTDSTERDTATAETAPAGTSATADSSDNTTTASATPAAAPATLPEQLLALLNGLAGATAVAPVPAADAASTLAPTDTVLTGTLDPRAAGNTAKTPLPALPTAASQSAAAPVEGEATAAFAMAMGAAAANDGDANATETALTASAVDDAASAPTTPLTIASATVHPLSRATAAAVAANQPLGLDAGFDDGFGSRIAWMAEQRVGHAEIRVSPDHLGTIDVRLQLDGNRVNAEFHSAQADVRQALESSLPRLRDMLGQQGLQLGHADVGQRQPGEQQASSGQASGSTPAGNGGERGNDAGWTPGLAARATRGLLDEYA
ncbi:flagellar hook-length control protein FliK [Lysobacter panacisoli]|uniref:Flagellar hook-length control protein FliK n=1 Tax=Lysobacter panacisoli TaxID=1255263 RepID=A0ABP9LHH7_9GAMM|nr:flagellar hook-length control protein FliK [Lysobacter panacisoli]